MAAASRVEVWWLGQQPRDWAGWVEDIEKACADRSSSARVQIVAVPAGWRVHAVDDLRTVRSRTTRIPGLAIRLYNALRASGRAVVR